MVFWPWNTGNPPTNIQKNSSINPKYSNRDTKYRKSEKLLTKHYIKLTQTLQTLTREEKSYVETLTRIISEKKTILPSLRNQDWRTVKSETKKVDGLVTNIPTNDISELNDLIYARAKLVSENIWVSLKIKGSKSKPGWELRLESQMKRLR